METHITPRCIPLSTVATHPVAGTIRQRLAVRLVVPATQRHVPRAIPLLALLAGVITVTGVRHPERVGRPHTIVLDDELEVAAGALKRSEALCWQQQQNLHQQVMRQHQQIRLRCQKLLQSLTELQEVLRRRCTPAKRHCGRAGSHTHNLLLLRGPTSVAPFLLQLSVRATGGGAGLGPFRLQVKACSVVGGAWGC